MPRIGPSRYQDIRDAAAEAEEAIALEVQELGVRLQKRLSQLMLEKDVEGAELKAATFATNTLSKGIERGLEGWFGNYALVTKTDLNDAGSAVVQSALGIVRSMIRSADQVLFLQAVFGPEASAERVQALSDRIERVHHAAHAHSPIRSEVQVAALLAIADFSARMDQILGEFEDGIEVEATAEDQLGYLLSTHVSGLQPPSPTTWAGDYYDAYWTGRAERNQLAYQAVVCWQRVGRPPKGQLGKFEAANRFLTAMGFGAASATALEHTWVMRKKNGLDSE